MTEAGTNSSDSPSDTDVHATARTLGDFRLLRKLGQGGMAEVWLAEQTSLARRVALKLLRKELMQDATYVVRFQREASSAGGLNHPNIVQVHVVGEEAGQHYIAQEYVQGVTLRAYLRKKGPLELPVALRVMRQAAAALKAAGDAGIVHRDIKPENIMMTRNGEVKVADFGLAQLHGAAEGADITQVGMTIGTPLYMSPEQVHGQKVDPRSDIYSFGATCYHMLVGRPPFEGPTAMSIAVKHLQEQARPLADARPDLPPAVVGIVSRMLAKKPEDRYQNAGEVLADIRRVQKAVRGGSSESEAELSISEAVTDQEFPSAETSVRRAPAILTVIFLLAAGSSAALGWFMRPSDPRATEPRPTTGSIKDFATSRQQYLHAMLLANNEDAFLAVVNHPQADPVWTRRAQEQLALLYLRDRHRWEDAEQMLSTLHSYDHEHKRYAAEALAGRAILRAYQGRHRESRNLLDSQLDSELRGLLPERSPFRRLISEAEMLNRKALDRSG